MKTCTFPIQTWTTLNGPVTCLAGGDKSRDLMKASVPMLPDANCTELIRRNFVLRRGFPLGAGNGILCALDREDGSDACQVSDGLACLVASGLVYILKILTNIISLPKIMINLLYDLYLNSSV
jgi:hypothetical protein